MSVGITECEICGRVEDLTDHHFIPKSEMHKNRHRNKYSKQKMMQLIAKICRPCHDQIHMIFTNQQLANNFDTIAKLKEHPEIQKWKKFIQTKPVGFKPQMTPKQR